MASKRWLPEARPLLLGVKVRTAPGGGMLYRLT